MNKEQFNEYKSKKAREHYHSCKTCKSKHNPKEFMKKAMEAMQPCKTKDDVDRIHEWAPRLN